MKKLILAFLLITGFGFGQSLTGVAPSASYKDLLHISNANLGLDGTLRTVYDGLGNASGLKLSLNGISAGGFTNLSGSTKIYNTTAGNAVHLRTAAGDTTLTGMANIYGVLNIKNSGGNETATLGSEALGNNSFVDSTIWTFGNGWRTSTTAGSVTHVVDSTATLTQAINVTNGTVYQIAVTIANRTVGSITYQLGSLDIAYSGVTATQTKTYTATATTVLTFTVTPTATFDGAFTEISIKPITLGSVTANANFYNAAGTLSAELRTNTSLSNHFFGLGSGSSNTTGSYNSFLGTSAGYSNTTGSYNSFLGTSAGYSNTTGYYNSFLGMEAGRFIAGGIGANATGSTSIFIGQITKALADGQTNQIVIGDTVTGKGSNTVVLGNALTTDVYLSSDSGATVHAGVFAGTSLTRGSDAFVTTATSDTVTISTAAVTDYYVITLTGTAAPAATDAVNLQKTATGFILWRGAAGTSGLTYNWFRSK